MVDRDVLGARHALTRREHVSTCKASTDRASDGPILRDELSHHVAFNRPVTGPVGIVHLTPALRRFGPRTLTFVRSAGRAGFAILSRGEVSEWLMVPLSKSGVRKHRGFESRPLRQDSSDGRPATPPVGFRLSGERSPSGLWRRTGNAVRGNPSRVRIPPSPPHRPPADSLSHQGLTRHCCERGAALDGPEPAGRHDR